MQKKKCTLIYIDSPHSKLQSLICSAVFLETLRYQKLSHRATRQSQEVKCRNSSLLYSWMPKVKLRITHTHTHTPTLGTHLSVKAVYHKPTKILTLCLISLHCPNSQIPFSLPRMKANPFPFNLTYLRPPEKQHGWTLNDTRSTQHL